MLACLLATLSLLPGSGLPGPELEVPENQGWVTDLAGLLSSSERQTLTNLMESYRSGSGHEIALLTIPSLEDDALESFTLRVAEAWGLGGEERDEGALLLISRDDRRMRIEVGYGLEGNLPDVICGRILDDVVAPEFRAGNWFAGIRAGIEAIHAAAGGDYGPIQRSSRAKKRSMGSFAIFPLVILFLALGMGRRGRGQGGGWVLPWILLSSMGNGGRGGGSGGGGSFGGGGFGGFSGGGGFGGGGASGGW